MLPVAGAAAPSAAVQAVERDNDCLTYGGNEYGLILTTNAPYSFSKDGSTWQNNNVCRADDYDSLPSILRVGFF